MALYVGPRCPESGAGGPPCSRGGLRIGCWEEDGSSGRGLSVPRASGGAGPYPGATFLGWTAPLRSSGHAGMWKMGG